jgi:hypothetical protein
VLLGVTGYTASSMGTVVGLWLGDLGGLGCSPREQEASVAKRRGNTGNLTNEDLKTLIGCVGTCPGRGGGGE